MNNKKELVLIPGIASFLFLSLSGYLAALDHQSIWSFAVIADPHIQGNPDHTTRLMSCVSWINQHKEEKLIKLVFVLGDIAWGNESRNTADAKEILDQLDVPYIPLIGDNEISGDDTGGLHFAGVFEPQYILLSTLLQNWKKEPACVWNPELERNCYLQNFSFDHEGVHFIAADWVSRNGEDAELHNFLGGTWPWFAEDLTNCQKSKKENIVILSHHPMCSFFGTSPYGFSNSEFNFMKDFTVQFADHIYANLAGHFHINGSFDLTNSAGYKVYVTDATFDDENALRLVYVFNFLERFYYFHRIYRPDRSIGVFKSIQNSHGK